MDLMDRKMERAAQYARRNRLRRAWRNAVIFLACIVVFCTTYALIMPAITMERTCGMEEHAHQESCYTQLTSIVQTSMTCEFAPHVHTEECPETCGYADFAVHDHNDLCYADEECICQLPVVQVHAHSDTCYQPVHTHVESCYNTVLGALLCEVPTSEGHAHGDDCYTNIEICGLTEQEDHAHIAECYEQLLFCTLEESEGHEHEESCFVQIPVLVCTEDAETLELVCTRPEIALHTHEDACFQMIENEEGVQEKILICIELEVVVHTHTEDCLTRTETAVDPAVLTCQLAEDENHTHTAMCYGVWELRCGKEAHAHTETCEPVEETEAPSDESTEEATGESMEETEEDAENPWNQMLYAIRPTKYEDGGPIDGTNLTWELTQNTLTGVYTLTIEGEGTMPNYGNWKCNQPWYKYRNKVQQLVIGDGITEIGEYCFQAMGISSIDLGKVQIIGKGAFESNAGTVNLVLPATVTEVKADAFHFRALKSVKLNEGLKKIGANAFGSNDGYISPIYIPASVEEIGATAFAIASNYTVAESNNYFCAKDGILFSYDETVLVDYPRYKEMDKFCVPENCKISTGALQSVAHVWELYIPATVTYTHSSFPALLSSSNYQRVYIEDGFKITDSVFFWLHGNNTSEIRLPDDSVFVMDTLYPGDSPLESLNIPNKVTRIKSISYTGKYHKKIRSIYYNAENATIDDREIFGKAEGYTLVIGQDVNNIPSTFCRLSIMAGAIEFEGENTLFVESGAFADTPAPINQLSGHLYVDAQGVIYTFDPDSLTAAVVYCRPGVQHITIPATIMPDDGNPYSVIELKRNFLIRATDLQSIAFEAPLAIKSLETLSLANCPTLTSVAVGEQVETTVEGATALFAGADVGYNMFYNTGLTGASGAGVFDQEMDGVEDLSVSADGATKLEINIAGENLQWADNGDSTGGYRLLTGQAITITASVGNTEEGQNKKYRVYFRVTSDEGKLSITPGIAEEFNDWPVSYHATDDPYTVYMEFGTPPEGNTSGLPAICSYPNVTSSGGGLTVWGVIIDPNEPQGSIIEPDSSIQISWTTQADDFSVSKVAASTNTLGVISNGAGDVKPSDNLKWTIVLKRITETTSQYGKDYARGAEFADVFTLPAGIMWQEDVAEAIANGTITVKGNILYAGDRQVATIAVSGANLYGRSYSLTLENGQHIFRWGVSNTILSAEMNAVTVTMTVYADALRIDPTTFDTTAASAFTNEVYATVHYAYRENAEYTIDAETGDVQNSQLYATATRNISGGKGALLFEHVYSAPTYFGEDITFTLRAYNNGALPWIANAVGETVGYTIQENLQTYFYISPENMERMFMENPQLKIHIQNASLGQWQTAKGVEGGEAFVHPGNSDGISTTQGNTLVISTDWNGYTVTVNDGISYTAATVKAALQQAGYAVTCSAQYVCVWPLSETNQEFVLASGENRYFYVYATVKNSLQMIRTDWPMQYKSGENEVLSAIGTINDPDGGVLKRIHKNPTAKRELMIGKSVTRDGDDLPDSYAASDGDVLDYQLTLTHYGTGSPEDLPLVDDLFGSQYLLVPIAYNPDLSYLNTHGDCYVLTEGFYQNVVVGIDDEGAYLNADSIEVVSAENGETIEIDGNSYNFTGLHTKIKWYFPELPADTYQILIKYQSLVDLDLTGVDYTIGNIAMLNDRANDRLYASLWGGGTLVEFDKDIVLEKGNKPAEDELAPDKHSAVGEGEQVTYRLTICSTQEAITILKGERMADALPLCLDDWPWQKGVNVTDFKFEKDGNITCKNLDDWYIGDSYGGIVGARKYILWPEDTQITFNESGTLYLYFTLTYPADVDENLSWKQYADLIGGDNITNDFYLYRYAKTVTHELKEPGRVLLQKGVYGTYQHTNNWDYTQANTRLYYNNRDRISRAVAYYVVLYNDGNTRLYLDKLQDQLPDGFTFLNFMPSDGFVNGGNATKVVTTANSSPLTDFSRSSISYRSATITVDQSDGLSFVISKGTGNNSVRYDTVRNQYYLDRGEAIEFGYLCSVGLSADTEDAATNMIAMPYTDHTGSGATVVMTEELYLEAAESAHFNDQNNGNRMIKSDQQMEQEYGLTGAKTWLVSEVTMHRGGIIPGVTKETVSYVNQDGSVTDYVNQVPHLATVNWRVRLHNAGTLAMTDYTFTDIMPYPYSFVGNVTYTMYGGTNYAGTPVSLISIPEHTPTDGLSVAITDLTNNGKRQAVIVNGSPVAFGANENNRFYVSLKLDEHNNEVLEIRFVGLYMSIMENGYMDINLSSVNLSNSYTYSVYTNQALLTPVQEFTTVGQGSMVRDEQNQPVSAKNASSVTVSIGFATSSDKAVAEIGHSEDATFSSDYIVLSSKESLIEYKLTVSNDTERAMTKLVLIDNLPEIGDHNPFDINTDRNSEFMVAFADDPQVVVRIYEEGKESYVLSNYDVQYSTGTDFGGPQSEHWKGLNPKAGDPTAWTDDSKDARSIRIIINSEIPKDARVEVTFRARINGTAKPGQTAVNNFGYHYALSGQTVELEAMSPVVAIKVPSVPSLVKRLVDANGAETKALDDAQFRFLVYEGAALVGNYTTRESLCAALDEAGRTYREITLTVTAGNVYSEQVDLMFADWTWEAGHEYTVAELPTGEQYSFRRFVNTSKHTYSFTYDPAQKQWITCENILNVWSIDLHKENPAGESLEGAVFALYSPVAADQISSAGFDAKEQIDQGGSTWYLAAIGTSDADGLVQWQDLPRSYYYLREIKAPDGYKLSESGQIFYRSGAVQGVYELTVVNRAGYELPQTGGSGITPYIAGGTLLMATAIVLLVYLSKPKRRKEEDVSF